MDNRLFSQSWYRVAKLKPAIRKDTQWSRQVFRGQRWYVLRDTTSGKTHRFNESAKLAIEKMDGQNSLNSIWESVCKELGDDMPGQDELIQLLSQLYRNNLVRSETLPDLKEMAERSFREERLSLLQYLKSPMALRLPLWNPDPLLQKISGLAVFFFNRSSAAVFALCIIVALIQLGIHWQDVTNNFKDQAFSATNWLLIALVYPFVKLLHEIGHGLAIKRWGGETREMGLMFLVFIPVPYVDASESTLFHRKYQRIVVSLAGIFTELILASLAFFIWIHIEPGIIRAVLFNIMLIGSVSTVLFNGNPLLKFDAYFALADFIEIPNLGQRSNQYIGYLIKRYALKVNETSPATSLKESCWFTGYSICSFLYRTTVMLGIALFVASQFFFFGVILAFWTLFQSCVMPLFRVVKTAWNDSLVKHYRTALYIFIGLSGSSVVMIALFLPLPWSTVTQGVYWAPEKSQIRAGADCFVTRVLADNNHPISPGQAILQCESAELRANSELIKAQLSELQARYRALAMHDQTESAILREEIARVEGELTYSRERLAATVLRAASQGQLRLERAADLPGKFITRGSYIGYIDNGNLKQVRVAVSQRDIAAVRLQTKTISARKATQLFEHQNAKLLREVPLGSGDIPSDALTTEGGGDIVLDPQSKKQIQALENWFQFDIQLEQPGNVGERVYIRFEHPSENLFNKVKRQIRRLFLSQFSV